MTSSDVPSQGARSDNSVYPESRSAMSNHVIILHIWPGMTVAQLKLMLSEPTTKGVVMYTYGAGNFPMVDEMLDVLKDAIKQGVVSLSSMPRVA
jgi:L-asparaginase/Glu-tRNA(Gln) amidotransferase subunit D